MTALFCAAGQGQETLISSPPLLPSCPALLCCQPGQGDGARSPSRGCPAPVGSAGEDLCQHILNILSQSPEPTELLPCAGIGASVPFIQTGLFQRVGNSSKELGEPQNSLFAPFPHSVSPFESGNFSDLAPQRVGEGVGWQQGWEEAGNSSWEPGTGDSPAWPCRKPGENAAPLLDPREGIPPAQP